MLELRPPLSALILLLSLSSLLAAMATVARGAGSEPVRVGRADTSPATITVDRGQRFQTINGWAATAQAGLNRPDFGKFSEKLFDLAVEDLGINRLRLVVASGLESGTVPSAAPENRGDLEWRCGRYLTVNDNDDPNSADWRGFHFERLDENVEQVVLPIKRRLEARGEKLYVYLQYVAFLQQCKEAGMEFDYVHARPDEYAEFILAVFLHLREKFGLVPDGLGVILEPDNGTGWIGERIGRAMVATAARLAAAGIRTEFIAPSTTNMSNAARFVDEIVAVPGARELLTELSYHRYGGVSSSALGDIAARAAKLGARTAMLEHINGDVEELYTDLTLGRASAWQQFTLAFSDKETGGQYYRIVDRQPVLTNRSRFLRQYFRYVRTGAVRIGAESDDAAVRAVAFENRGERVAVVVHVDGPSKLVVRGLPAGAYGASLTSHRKLGTELGRVEVGVDGVARWRAPEKGVLTVYSAASSRGEPKP